MIDASSNAHEMRLKIFQLQSCLAKLWGFQKDFIFIHTTAQSVYPGQWGGTDPACVLQWVGRPLLTQQPCLDTPERAEAAGCRLFISEDCRGRWQIFIFEQIAVRCMHTKQASPFTESHSVRTLRDVTPYSGVLEWESNWCACKSGSWSLSTLKYMCASENTHISKHCVLYK